MTFSEPYEDAELFIGAEFTVLVKWIGQASGPWLLKGITRSYAQAEVVELLNVTPAASIKVGDRFIVVAKQDRGKTITELKRNLCQHPS